jgi:transposase
MSTQDDVEPLEVIAHRHGVSVGTVWRWISRFELTKYRLPGKGKKTHLDPEEVRRKVRAQVVE